MTDPVIRRLSPKAHGDHPPFTYRDYRSTVLRAPQKDLVRIVNTLSETTGPGPAISEIAAEDADLTTNAGTRAEAIGQRTIVTGRVLDQNGDSVAGTLVEIWQANAAGRYAHWRDGESSAPIDPNFLGMGQTVTDAEGVYRFTTIKPGPYPWGNHPNAWRPSHIHFSLMGTGLGSRLVTQMYFEGDPMLGLDPIFNAVPEHSRSRMIATYDHSVTEEGWATGYRWDIVIRGVLATPTEAEAS